MTVCKFFLEGRCNFGSSCRNEHPVDAQQRNNHRFGATDSNNPLRGRIGFPNSSSDYPAARIYDDRSIRSDLSKDRPEYKYSCYGPAKEEPNLLEGIDFSPEELRVQYYNIMSTNGVDTAYRAGVKDLDERMQSRIDSILRDVRSTLTQFDAKRQQLAQQQASSGFAFGQPPQPQPQPVPQQQETYGTPSVLGAPAPSATPSPFGSSINQPNQPNQPNTPLLGSTYNQPTAPTPLFGANPSGFGSSNYSGSLSNYPVAQAQPNAGSIFGYQPPQQPDPQQQYLLQMQQQQQQQELYAQQQQQQQQQQQMLMMQQMQQQPPQPGNTQGTINNPQMQAFASSQFELYKIPEIPPPSDFRR